MLIGKKTIGTVGYMGGILAIPEQFAWSWTQMIQYNNDYLIEPTQKIHYTRATVSFHSFARNILVDNIMGDWILMLDTDHQFEPDIVARMLYYFEKDKLDVLTGIYQYVHPPYMPKIYRFNKELTNVEYIGDWERLEGNYYIPIEAAGGGCLMIRRSLIKAVEKKFKCKPFDIITPFSEDLSFFLRLKKMGVKVMCAPMIEYNHLEVRPVELKNYDPSKLKFDKKIKVL